MLGPSCSVDPPGDVVGAGGRGGFQRWREVSSDCEVRADCFSDASAGGLKPQRGNPPPPEKENVRCVSSDRGANTRPNIPRGYSGIPLKTLKQWLRRSGSIVPRRSVINGHVRGGEPGSARTAALKQTVIDVCVHRHPFGFFARVS